MNDELLKILAQADAVIAFQNLTLARDAQKMNIEQLQDPEALRRRIMNLEAVLVYVKNFLPDPLKKHAEEVLFGQPESTQ